LIETTITLIGLLIVLCGFCQWPAWGVKLPAIIFLLAAGSLLGLAPGLLFPPRPPFGRRGAFREQPDREIIGLEPVVRLL
jgi:hypothetical protein